MTRLLEECGELAKEIGRVIGAALQAAIYYGVKKELKTSMEWTYQRLKAEGWIVK